MKGADFAVVPATRVFPGQRGHATVVHVVGDDHCDLGDLRVVATAYSATPRTRSPSRATSAT